MKHRIKFPENFILLYTRFSEQPNRGFLVEISNTYLEDQNERFTHGERERERESLRFLAEESVYSEKEEHTERVYINK